MKDTYTATKWNIFKHRMGIQPRVCFMVYPYHAPYKNWISKKLWKFWYYNPNRKY